MRQTGVLEVDHSSASLLGDSVAMAIETGEILKENTTRIIASINVLCSGQAAQVRAERYRRQFLSISLRAIRQKNPGTS